MATIVTRSGKGSPLTNTEVDSNFSNLNTDKLEDASGSTSSDGNEYVRKNGAWAVATGGGASVTTSATAPSSPSDGDLWFSETNGVTYVYYNDGSSSQWVASGAPVLEQFQAAGTSVGTLQTVTNNGASSSNAISVAGLTSNSITYPTTDGSDGEVLQTNGSGTLSIAHPKLQYISVKGLSAQTIPSSGSFFNPVGTWQFQTNGRFPSSNGSIDSTNQYITLPTGVYFVSLTLYTQRSDTGAAISAELAAKAGSSKYGLNSAFTIPAGTASSYDLTTFTSVFAWTTSSWLLYLDLESAFSSTQAKFMNNTIMNLIRIG